jgi:hypothetical protein
MKFYVILFLLQLPNVCIYTDYIYVGEETQCDIPFISGTKVHIVNNSSFF